jgi:hypothetical protein
MRIAILLLAITSIASASPITDYLDQKFDSTVTHVEVTRDHVLIKGRLTGNGPFALADIPMDVELNAPESWQTTTEIAPTPDANFSIRLPRQRLRDGHPYDRLTSRWQVVSKTEQAFEPQSHARYADTIESRSPDLPPALLRNKKGLGGWHDHHLPNELRDLGISAVTINVMVHTFISLTPEQDTTPFQWQGRTLYANNRALERMDRQLLTAQKDGVMVSAILLVGNPATTSAPVIQAIGHPDATKDGHFSMPNVTSADAIATYGGILNLMAERWSQPAGKYGRIHHWIVHNEVDAAWSWTNAGQRDVASFMDLYQRSLRLTDLITRQYDPNSRAFISLDHHWTKQSQPQGYSSKEVIDLLVRFGQAEGDFPWAMAYHPYPQNLFEPKTWLDTEATFSFQTAKITPRNIEVLDAYMKQPSLLYKGEIRPIHLSENGFNSKSYSTEILAEQAAGMAYAWKKIQSLPSIRSWQYHNWVDNRHEGGLKIGLRKFPDEENDPLGKKPIWHLYQALGTPNEDEAAAPYLNLIGLKAWSEILHKEAIQ